MAAAAGDAAEGDVPLLVRVLAGKSVTSATVLACLNTPDARQLRRLRSAVVGVVAGVPWRDTDTPVVDAIRWRAGLPGAVGARLAEQAVESLLASEPAVAALGGITHLDLQKCASVTNDVLLRLPTSLRVLNVRDCSNLTAAASFAHLTALASLDCTWTTVVSERTDGLPPSLTELDISLARELYDSMSLAHLRQLRVLCVDGIKLDDATLAALPPSLEELHAAGCWDLPSTASFAHLTALRQLHVAHSSMTDASLASAPPSLVFLHARGCKELTRAAVLPHLPALQLLDVSGTNIGDALVASLPASLTELRVSGCRGLTASAGLDHLRVLRLLHCIDTALAPATMAACRARGCVVSAARQLRGHGSGVGSLAVLGDGRLASSGYGEVRLWDVAAGGEATAVLRDGARVSALAALPGGSHLAIGTASWERNEGCIEVWDAGGVPPVRRATIDFHCRVWALAALADGRLAAGCGDSEVRVVGVPVDTGAVVTTLTGHMDQVTALAVLPDGALASGSLDTSVRVWDVASRACVATLAGHAAPVNCLVVLADSRLASSDNAGAVRLWDVGARACVDVLQSVHTRIVITLAALPDGRLATGSQDGAIRLWDTRPAAAAAASRAATAVPVEVVGRLRSSVRVLLPLPDGRLVCGSESFGHGDTGATMYLLELSPPAA